MENASKALLIAAGVIISLLLITVLIFSFRKISEYQSSNKELADIQNTADFNEQFLQYDREDVKGYEIVSLVNRISDYNSRMSNVGKNDVGYNPISFSLNLVGKNSDFVYDNSGKYDKLFKINQYDNNSFQLRIIQPAVTLENKYGGSDVATKLAKNLNTFIMNGSDFDTAKKTFNAYCKTIKINSENDLKKELPDIFKCYEYMQFKNAVFKCGSVGYDNATGRVNSISFEYTGKIY